LLPTESAHEGGSGQTIISHPAHEFRSCLAAAGTALRRSGGFNREKDFEALDGFSTRRAATIRISMHIHPNYQLAPPVVLLGSLLEPS